MRQYVSRTGLSITDPLVLYRSLLATKQIVPDPAQHRLALHLQKLYEQLKDYEPSLEYGHRLKRLSQVVSSDQDEAQKPPGASLERQGVWSSLLAEKERRESVALTRVLTSHEKAMHLDSPKGLMLHGEVGTGKSLLIDLFAECLPTRKKRRYHYSTFMLETITKLEQLRLARSSRQRTSVVSNGDEHSLLWLARELIQTSPILFLDEFQLPDRAASKIMSTLMTSFFQLGGVLIATSNRMPEELAKAAGIEYAPPPSRFQALKLWTSSSKTTTGGRTDSMFAGHGEFANFLELLRARCDIWEMEGSKDYRRIDSEKHTIPQASDLKGLKTGDHETQLDPSESEVANALPMCYLINPSQPGDPQNDWDASFKVKSHQATGIPPTTSIPWEPSSFRVYGRIVSVPRHCNGVSWWTFSELCVSRLGPADYLTLASTFHTIILTEVPILTLLQKNEARRLITLLDALYESRCKLLVSAAAGPDDIFFPERDPRQPSVASGALLSGLGATSQASGSRNISPLQHDEDAVLAETFSEAYQDVAAPFRPNISSYGGLAEDALEDDPPNRARRAAGVTEGWIDEQHTIGQAKIDFSRTDAFTGEDERFAFKRAQSRLWEMCGEKWWARGEDGEGAGSWWRPLDTESRGWESDRRVSRAASLEDDMKQEGSGKQDEAPEGWFRHGASPFRVHRDPPPKLSATHVWGMMTWGKKAGAWGKGVEGIKERQSGKNSKGD